MKSVITILMLMLVHTAIFAQAPCSITIEPSFDSECIITDFDGKLSDFIQSESNCNFVCKNSEVTYKAVGINGTYTWYVWGVGANSYTTQGNTLTVQWGNNALGTVRVEVTTANGSVCSAEMCVVLFDPPQIGAIILPTYNYVGGVKVIDICLGETISFTDNSTATGTSPIVSHYWGSPYGIADTEYYEIIPSQAGSFQVEHTIINSCGCKSSEIYEVVVRNTELNFELECYGTACAGSTHRYTLTEPLCSQYIWTVKDGFIIPVAGQNPNEVTIRWNNSSVGYGVISLDLSHCNAGKCANNSIRIPIISDNVEISGPDVVCVDEKVVYELPLWGSTEYVWTINPPLPPYVVFNKTYKNANSRLVSFNTVGTYEISVNYYNGFLNCGRFHSLPKTIQVKERLEIDPESSSICKGETKIFTTNSMPQPSTWRIYNSANQLVYTTPNPVVSLNYTFNTAGTFKVVADNVDACNTATSTITVAAPPPPPSIDAVLGPKTACPGTSIGLSATPTSSMYSIVWEPVCLDYKRTGDMVTIDYEDTVCNVKVYQRDMTTGCLSDPIIYTVNNFVLDAFNIQSPITVCAGQTLPLSVSKQDGVLYHWTIDPVRAASVEGNDHSNAVNIVVNRLANVSTPYPITVQLKREYCGTETYDIVILMVNDVEDPTVTHNPDPICQNMPVTFTATDNLGNILGSCSWSFDSDTEVIGGNTGNPKQVIFKTSGQHSYTLIYNPIIGCNPVIVPKNVFVTSEPDGTITPLIINSEDHLGISHHAGSTYSYSWKKDGNSLGLFTQTINVYDNGVGTYCCTISDGTCEKTVCMHYGGNSPPPSCPTTSISLSKAHIGCNTYSITASNQIYPADLSWSISPHYSQNSLSTYLDPSGTTATFKVPGTFFVGAYANVSGICYKGSEKVEIDYVLKLDILLECPNTLKVYDNSAYRPGYTIPQRDIDLIDNTGTVISTYTLTDGNDLIATFTLPPVSVPTTYTAYMKLGSGITACEETKTFTQYPLPNITPSIRNPYCQKTPLKFEITGTNISRVDWEFGDGASLSGSDNIVYHTYGNVQLYNLKITAYNSNGCSTIYSDTIDIQLNTFLTTGNISSAGQVCMGYPQTLYWLSNPPDNNYEWSTPPTNSGFQHFVYQSGNHSVTVTSGIGCVCQKMENVSFFHTPIAKIAGETSYCFGEPIMLYGDTGEDNITYQWNITAPNGNFDMATTPNIEISPAIAGTYYVELIVYNADFSCYTSADINVKVFPLSPPPVLEPVGDPCINKLPVCLRSADSRDLYWSNGFYGNMACFYTEGFVTARYIDQNGCYSEYGDFMICPKPDFDALLTGCYERCENYEYTDKGLVFEKFIKK